VGFDPVICLLAEEKTGPGFSREEEEEVILDVAAYADDLTGIDTTWEGTVRKKELVEEWCAL
jgi:hypothetical protein